MTHDTTIDEQWAQYRLLFQFSFVKPSAVETLLISTHSETYQILYKNIYINRWHMSHDNNIDEIWVEIGYYFISRCQDVVLSLSLGIVSRIVMDSAICRSASSAHFRTMRAVREVSVGDSFGCSLRKCSPTGVPTFLLTPSRRCSLYLRRTGRLVSPTYVLPHKPHTNSYTTFLMTLSPQYGPACMRVPMI